MTKMKVYRYIKGGFLAGVGFFVAVFVGLVVYSWNGIIAEDGDTLTYGVWNDMVDMIATKVGKGGDELIGGVKTFSSFPVTPSNAPNSDYEVVNKKYVDDSIANNAIGDGDIPDTITRDSELLSHTSDVNNPHSVTKAQIGLSNVANIDQTNASNITSGTLNQARLPTGIDASKFANGTISNTELQYLNTLNTNIRTWMTKVEKIGATLGHRVTTDDSITSSDKIVRFANGSFMNINNASSLIVETNGTNFQLAAGYLYNIYFSVAVNTTGYAFFAITDTSGNAIEPIAGGNTVGSDKFRTSGLLQTVTGGKTIQIRAVSYGGSPIVQDESITSSYANSYIQIQVAGLD